MRVFDPWRPLATASVLILLGCQPVWAQDPVATSKIDPTPARETMNRILFTRSEHFATIPTLAVGREYDVPGDWRWAIYNELFQEIHQGGTDWDFFRNTTALAHGDVDGDGRDELAVGRGGAAGMRWAIHDEPLTQFPSMIVGGELWSAERQVTAMAFGDVDGDGLDELAVGRTGPDQMRWVIYDDLRGEVGDDEEENEERAAKASFDVLINGGVSWDSGRQVTALAFGDVDGDGLDELAVGRNGPDNMRWAIYDDAKAGFVELVTGGEKWGPDRQVTALAFGDVDGDDVDELAVGRNGPDNMRWAIYNDAKTGFSELVAGGESWDAGRDVTALALGDVDGDGVDELAVGRNGPSDLRWAIYEDAEERFQQLVTGGESWEGDRDVTALVLGDVDGDRLAELVVGRNSGPGPSWLFHDDAGAKFLELFAASGGGAGVTALSLGQAGICGDGSGGDEGTKKYCVRGTPRGVGYSWKVSSKTLSFEELFAPPVSALGDAADLATAFVDSLNAVGCPDHAFIDPAAPECFHLTIRGEKDFDLTVGSQQTPDCVVTRALLDGGKPGGCTYNPTLIQVDDSVDCNINGVDDLLDITDDIARDLNSNLIPDECERGTRLSLAGTALGGEISVTIEGASATCTVTIDTLGVVEESAPPAKGGTEGSAADVAMRLAEAINTDDCLLKQNISAIVSGSRVTIVGFRLGDHQVMASSTDPGLQIIIPLMIPTLSSWGLIMMLLLLLPPGLLLTRRATARRPRRHE